MASWLALAFRRFAETQAENLKPGTSRAQWESELRTRFANERVFPSLSGDRFLLFLQTEASRRGVDGIDAYSCRVGGSQQLKAQIDAQPSMSLLKDAGGWSSTSMPLYYGGHSIEGSRYIAQYMVRPVTALPK